MLSTDDLCEQEFCIYSQAMHIGASVLLINSRIQEKDWRVLDRTRRMTRHVFISPMRKLREGFEPGKSLLSD